MQTAERLCIHDSVAAKSSLGKPSFLRSLFHDCCRLFCMLWAFVGTCYYIRERERATRACASTPTNVSSTPAVRRGTALPCSPMQYSRYSRPSSNLLSLARSLAHDFLSFLFSLSLFFPVVAVHCIFAVAAVKNRGGSRLDSVNEGTFSGTVRQPRSKQHTQTDAHTTAHYAVRTFSMYAEARKARRGMKNFRRSILPARRKISAGERVCNRESDFILISVLRAQSDGQPTCFSHPLSWVNLKMLRKSWLT